MPEQPLVPESHPIELIDFATERSHRPGDVVATQDHELIRRWALQHGAEPATGEASSSGPATVRVQDGDAGIRFNFPAAGRFRPITWEEWFSHFNAHDLAFVYEVDAPGASTSRYRLVPRQKLLAGCSFR